MSSSSSHATNPSGTSAFAGLSPVVLAVFLGFLAVSVPLGALSLEVGGNLGFGTIVVGSVIGLQSLATLLTRHQAGTLCDHRGPRRAVLIGLPLAASSGVAYVLSSVLPVDTAGKLAFMIAGRLVMGLGESLFLTGLMSLGIARLGADRTGRVMSWTGIAIYAALGLGAPLGLAAQAAYGFLGVGLVACLTPLLALAIIVRLPPTPAAGGTRVPFHRVLGLIWRPGLVLALAMVPFAVMAAFLPLHYAARGWSDAGIALFGFGAAYVLVRLVAPGLPDRFGATRVAIGSLSFELAGQVLLWLAPTPSTAALGAVLTGLGFSLVFPAMGVLATRSVPPDQRGRAVGNFIAFADIALGVTGPAVGLATQWGGIATAFLVGATATLAALLLLPSMKLGKTS
ncbi:major facilitator superfamily transporter [Hartmannibacter diazotrophicus]|uniref:Major facilitator superfamily transporter n=2 Tax=Hartmannibacter diazotrophicus TaxID=1482074 RepID=A0A2C9DBR0_9HYPH|nr:major facilitator superfamily transporter [Hartmannibacter diazotrophicus]